MRTGLIIALAVTVSSTAVAEDRAATITVGGHGVMQEGPDAERIFETLGGMRVTMAWETAPLPYPDRRGYNVGVALVPELLAGGLIYDDRAEAMVGAGVRAEEAVFGDYIYLGSPLRLGFEVGFTKRYAADPMALDPVGATVGFYLGWAPRP